jgi:hypothetical protein
MWNSEVVSRSQLLLQYLLAVAGEAGDIDGVFGPCLEAPEHDVTER